MIIDSYGGNSSCTISLLSTFNQFFVVLLIVCICSLANSILSVTYWFVLFAFNGLVL
jgi:hypothetical protein